MRVQVEEQRAADQERSDIDEERCRRTCGGDERPAEQGPVPRRTCRKCNVERGIRLALGVLCPVLEASLVSPAKPAVLRNRSRGARHLGAHERASRERGRAVERREQETPGSQKCQRSSASAAVATASKTYRPLSSLRRGGRLGASDQGRNDERRQRLAGEQQAATASALCVWS